MRPVQPHDPTRFGNLTLARTQTEWQTHAHE